MAEQVPLDLLGVLLDWPKNFPWIDLPIFEENGEPIHDRGIVANAPGMYFVGLHFLYAMTSATLLGIGRDSARVAKAIELRTQSASETARRLQPVIVA